MCRINVMSTIMKKSILLVFIWKNKSSKYLDMTKEEKIK